MSDEAPQDPFPALVAELDQAIALAPQVARVARGYFGAFKGEGFTDQQSLYLTATNLLRTPGTAP